MLDVEEPVPPPMRVRSRDGLQVGHVITLRGALGYLSFGKTIIKNDALLLQDASPLERTWFMLLYNEVKPK